MGDNRKANLWFFHESPKVIQWHRPCGWLTTSAAVATLV